ncbi:MAG: ABC transporter substrate-binding protein [Acidobacteriota bacterium]|nr:ABC transporter substrate-binding protein [Acidobacteriota bacterium]
MWKRWTILLVLCAGCQPNSPSSTSSEIVVGEYSSLTGTEATFGQSTHNGVTMAFEEINAAGGIAGRKVRVIAEDDQSKAEEAANAVTKLISSNNVAAIIGEVASSNSLAAAPICQSSRIPMISPSSTNPDVTRKGDYIFRMCFLDNYQGPVLARFTINDLHLTRAAVLIDMRSDYSRGLAEAFEQVYMSLGGKIVARQSFSKGDSDFRPQLTAIQAASPQIVFVPGYYNDVAPIAIQARDIGIRVPLLGGDGWESPKLLEIGGRSLEGCMYSNHYHSDDPAPSVRDFVHKYQQRFGVRPDSIAALAYDSARVLAAGIRQAGPNFTSQSLRDSLAATRNFPGVTGTITFDPNRNPIGKKVAIEEIKNGQLTLKATIYPQ